MNCPRDPWWLAPVDHLYGFALYLYPRRFREAWGESMRQTLRDRCRELVHSQRSPLLWICTDLLPDLTSSAGREQWTMFEEETTMKRMSLLTLLLLGSLGLLWWTQTSTVGSRLLISATDWYQARERHALESAYAEYRLDLIRTALTSDRPDERALAYLFTQWRTGAWDADVALQENADLQAVQTQLDASPVTDTPLTEFLAAGSCRSPSTLVRLQMAEPDNGAIWALTATCRQQVHDDAGVRAALLRLAQSTRYDSRSGPLLIALSNVLQRKPLPSEAAEHLPPLLMNALWNAHEPERDGLRTVCAPGPADVALRAVCRAAYAVLATHADSEWIRWVGHARVADADGQSIDENERTTFHRRLEAGVSAWWQLPAERRTALAASDTDERVLLVRAVRATRPL